MRKLSVRTRLLSVREKSTMVGDWTRATERTDSEILSFSHWAIMTQGHGEDRQWDTFILPLSYHDPGPRGGQTVGYIYSPTELSWPRATGRTDSGVHLFSHWAIMTQGRGEDRLWEIFILPLSYHDPGHGEDRQWDTFILPLNYHNPGHGKDRQWDTVIFPLNYHDLGHGEERQWDTVILPLSYHDSDHGEDRQWDTFILPLSYHDPGPRRGQTVRDIHSPTELSWPRPQRGQTMRYIYSPTELS